MNEAETRAELIDPKLKESGWGVIEGSKILREYHLTLGKLQTGHSGLCGGHKHDLSYRGFGYSVRRPADLRGHPPSHDQNHCRLGDGAQFGNDLDCLSLVGLRMLFGSPTDYVSDHSGCPACLEAL